MSLVKPITDSASLAFEKRAIQRQIDDLTPELRYLNLLLLDKNSLEKLTANILKLMVLIRVDLIEEERRLMEQLDELNNKY